MKIVRGVFTKIYQDIIQDRVKLPHLPDVSIKLRKALSNDNYSIDVIAKIILADVGASAYLLSVANSLMYKTLAEAKDIPSAIRIMGVSSVRNLIDVYALKSISFSDKSLAKKFLNGHWQRSTYQAAIAHVIAKMTKNIDADKALLAGLLQGVGVLPVLMKLDENELNDLSAQTIQASLDVYAAKVGIVLAKKWGLDEDLKNVIKNLDNFSYDSGDGIDLVDVVNIARLLSQIGSQKINWPHMEDAPCLRKFNEEGLTLASSIILLKEAQSDINEIKAILAGS